MQPRPRLFRATLTSSNTFAASFRPCLCVSSQSLFRRWAGRKLPPNPHPATRRRENERKWENGYKRVLQSPDYDEQELQSYLHVLPEILNKWRLVAMFNNFTSAIPAFVEHWCRACASARATHPAAPLPVNTFLDLVSTHLSTGHTSTQTEELPWENDCLILCRLMIMPRSNRTIRLAGQRLLSTMSVAGSETATIRILVRVLRNSQKDKDATKVTATSVKVYREHLQTIVDRGDNWQALVLAGQIAKELNQPKQAIELLTDALDAARTRYERARARSTDKAAAEVHHIESLAAPWNDLTELLWEQAKAARSEAARERLQARARQVNALGCDLDDPIAHFHAAETIESDWNWELDTANTYNHKYLYRMTKAAASGHVIAAYRMAQYYFTATWPYLRVEPPNEIKPTPFDQYPAPEGTVSRPPTAEEQLFFIAQHPSNLVERATIALEWLDIALSRFYLPAYIYAAEICLAEELEGLLQVPKAALEMSPLRYRYRNEEDYVADNRLPGSDVRPPRARKKPNTERAYEFIREAINACNSVRFFHDHSPGRPAAFVGKANERSRTETDHTTKAASLTPQAALNARRGSNSHMEEYQLENRVGEATRKWFRYPDVRAQWVPDLAYYEQEIKRICDGQGWEKIYGHDQSLLYSNGRFMGIAWIKKED